MAKIKFSLHGVARAIEKAEKKLSKIRPKVIEADQKRIDLNLRELKRSYALIRINCPPAKFPTVPFGQWFTKS